MKLHLLSALIACFFVASLGAMEGDEARSKSSGFEVHATYSFPDTNSNKTKITLGKGFIQEQKFPKDSSKSAIVCFTNNYLKKIVGTMSDSVYSPAGMLSLQEEFGEVKQEYCPIMDQQVSCPVGQAVCTSAGELEGVTNIIHTVIPNCTSKKQNLKRADLLQNAYSNSLQLAADKGIKYIAFPEIAETNKYPAQEAARLAIKTIVNFIKTRPNTLEEVRLVFSPSSDNSHDNYTNVLAEISETHKATSKITLNPEKFHKLETNTGKQNWVRYKNELNKRMNLIKQNWSQYKNEIILGGTGIAVVACAGWLWWHKK